MLAFVIAIIANLCWSFVNVIDKFLVSKYCKNGSVGSILILSSIFPIVLIPLGFFLGNSREVSTSDFNIFFLIIAGILTTCWTFFYLSALFDENVTLVIPLFQFTPIFVLIFSFIILSEIPNAKQLFFALIIIIGALILTYEKSTNKIKLKLVAQLSAASAIIALMNTIFKYAAINSDFWTSVMWQSTGTVIAGALILIFHNRFRSEFLEFIHLNFGLGISLNAVNEILVLVGNILFAYATLLAPIALIQTMGAYQPIFVLILTSLSVYIFSINGLDDLKTSSLKQKLAGISIVFIGSLLLSLTIQ